VEDLVRKKGVVALLVVGLLVLSALVYVVQKPSYDRAVRELNDALVDAGYPPQ
jgi:hypothetical protein